MNTKAPQKPPEGVEKPTEPTPILPDTTASEPVALLPHETTTGAELANTLADLAEKHHGAVHVLPAGWKIHQPQGFIVRVPLVCPHCSSYMRVLPSGTVMTCYSERCPNHLKKFKLPVLYAEEVED